MVHSKGHSHKDFIEKAISISDSVRLIFENEINDSFAPGATPGYTQYDQGHGAYNVPQIDFDHSSDYEYLPNPAAGLPAVQRRSLSFSIDTLARHANDLNVDGSYIDPQDREDLIDILINFDEIEAADGGGIGRGISMEDAGLILRTGNQRNDGFRNRDGYRRNEEMMQSLQEQISDLQAQLAELRGEMTNNIT